jgi:ribosomal-protein-alanine N-acetyltransferase
MIVTAGTDVAEALAGIHAQAFDRPWDAPSLTTLLRSPGVTALTDEARTGFILIRATADEAEILTLAVAPQARRRGLARALVRAACLEVKMEGAATLFLEVAADNPAAIALYRSEGFADAGRRPRYYPRPKGDAADALLLKKRLSTPA